MMVKRCCSEEVIGCTDNVADKEDGFQIVGQRKSLISNNAVELFEGGSTGAL